VCRALLVTKQLLHAVATAVDQLRAITLRVLGLFNAFADQSEFIQWRVNHDVSIRFSHRIKAAVTHCLALVEYTMALLQCRTEEQVKQEDQANLEVLLNMAKQFVAAARHNLEMPPQMGVAIDALDG
jgi:hypothetical protein